jgi:hypothetical protein
MATLFRLRHLTAAGALFLSTAACQPPAHHPMAVPATAVQQLHAFKSGLKFYPTEMYTGAWPEEVRPVLESILNKSADDFLAIAQANPTQEQYLQALAAGLAQIDSDELDTEDRERVAGQYERLLDIVGVESSEGQLNRFVYGALGDLLSGITTPDDDKAPR